MNLVRLINFIHDMSSMRDLHALFEILLETAVQFVQADQGSVMIYDQQRDDLNVEVIHLPRVRPGEGIAGEVFKSGTAALVSDIENDPRFAARRRKYRSGTFISVPLKVRDHAVGVINVSGRPEQEPFTEEDLRAIQVLANIASMAIERSDFFKELEELKTMSITDPLTGLHNRRFFQEKLGDEIERARRFRTPLSLLMLDIDDFKLYNDMHGHPLGDEALKLTGEAINRCVRVIDVVARYGGEEFAVILPQTDKEPARIVAERIRREVEETAFPGAEIMPKGRFTVSIGSAGYPEDSQNAEELVYSADTALYMAKAEGKNRVSTFVQSVRRENLLQFPQEEDQDKGGTKT